MEYRRIAGFAAEQRPRIEADALHATVGQQMVEQALFITFGEERRVANLDGHRPLQLIEEHRQGTELIGAKGGRQL